jgi:hypothetical protein
MGVLFRGGFFGPFVPFAGFRVVRGLELCFAFWAACAGVLWLWRWVRLNAKPRPFGVV